MRFGAQPPGRKSVAHEPPSHQGYAPRREPPRLAFEPSPCLSRWPYRPHGRLWPTPHGPARQCTDDTLHQLIERTVWTSGSRPRAQCTRGCEPSNLRTRLSVFRQPQLYGTSDRQCGTNPTCPMSGRVFYPKREFLLLGAVAWRYLRPEPERWTCLGASR